MAALVGENRIQREVLWISVPFKRFRVNDQQIIPRLSCQAVLGAARLAVHVAILNLPNKAQVCRDPSQPVQPGSELGTGERLGTGTPFWYACTLSDYDSPRKQSKAFSRRSAYDT
jgi:hypothetical protein